MQPGRLERGVEFERPLVVVLGPAVVAERLAGLAADQVGEGVAGVQPHELVGGVQSVALAAQRLVPRRELPPAPRVVGVFGEDRRHLLDGERAVVALRLDPGRPAAECQRVRRLERRRLARRQRVVVPAQVGQDFGAAVVPREELRVVFDQGVARRQSHLVVGLLAVGRLHPEDRCPRVELDAFLPRLAQDFGRSLAGVEGVHLVEGHLQEDRRPLAGGRRQLAEAARRRLHVVRSRRILDLLDDHLGAVQVLLEHGQRGAGLAVLAVLQAGVEQHHRRGRVAGVDAQRLAQVGLAALAVAGLNLGVAAHHQVQRRVGPQPHQLRSHLQETLRLADIVVPLGELLPAPEVVRVHSDERLHRRDGTGIVAAPRLDPGGAPLQHQRHVGGHRDRPGRLERVVEAAEHPQPLRLQVVSLDVLGVEGEGLVERRDDLVGLRNLRDRAGVAQPGARVAGAAYRQLAGEVQRLVGRVEPVGPHHDGAPGAFEARVAVGVEPHGLLGVVERLAAAVGLPQLLGEQPVGVRLRRGVRQQLLQRDQRVVTLLVLVERLRQLA